MDPLAIELTNVERSFMDRTVLNIPKLSVYQGDRIGVIGRNGSGKSTLLNIMSGRVKPDKGQVNSRIDWGYFEQKAASGAGEADPAWLGRWAVPKVGRNELSGGEETRAKLAKLFSSWHQGMLIDEPTSHLDRSGIEALIDELRYYYGALVLVSHDRDLLDQLITKIWAIDRGTVTEYEGNYSDYVRQKRLETRQQQERYEKYVKDKQRLLRAAEKKMQQAEKITEANQKMSRKETKAKANRMFMTKSKGTSQKSVQRAAKALEQRADKLDAAEAPEKETAIRFQRPEALTLHNKFPIMGSHVTLNAGSRTLLAEARFQFPLNRIIAITGPNGSGKSTLLRHIVRHGEGIDLSPKVVFGVYQQMAFRFSEKKTVFSFMKSRSDESDSHIRAVLHAMHFDGNDLRKDVRALSGGEAVRLTLCRLFLGRYNVLVLDEPTNFLDISCIEALERFLTAYPGTVLLVTHDRMLIEHVADRVYRIENQQLILEK